MNFLPKIYCSIFGHTYHVSKQITYHVEEHTCVHCKKQLAKYSDVKIVELTPKFKEINTILKHIHLNKMKRLKRRVCRIDLNRSFNMSNNISNPQNSSTPEPSMEF